MAGWSNDPGSTAVDSNGCCTRQGRFHALIPFVDVVARRVLLSPFFPLALAISLFLLLPFTFLFPPLSSSFFSLSSLFRISSLSPHLQPSLTLSLFHLHTLAHPSFIFLIHFTHMADTTVHVEDIPHAEAAVPAVEHAPVVEATTPSAESAPAAETTAAEPEATFSTAVEPSDAPVETGDAAPTETAAAPAEGEAEAATEEATEGDAEKDSPPHSTGSDKKKSWISKLTSNIKKLAAADKKPKTDKAAAAAPADGETPASTEEEAAAAPVDAAEAPITAPVVTTEITEEAAPAEAATEAPVVAEPAAEDKPAAELPVDAPQKLSKRLSFNIFKKKEKAAAPAPAPATVTEATDSTEAAAEGESTTATTTAVKDAAPVIETDIPTENVVEDTAVATAN